MNKSINISFLLENNDYRHVLQTKTNAPPGPTTATRLVPTLSVAVSVRVIKATTWPPTDTRVTVRQVVSVFRVQSRSMVLAT